jgi:ferredoxin
VIWLLRGLRNGVVTSRWPKRPDPYLDSFPARVAVVADPAGGDTDSVTALCPTQAISTAGSALAIDRGRCILCGHCVAERPGLFAWAPGAATARLSRTTLVTPRIPDTDENVAVLRNALVARVRRLRRSVHVRHVDAGSDGSDEWEVAALFNPVSS